jgi:hypothetical protein
LEERVEKYRFCWRATKDLGGKVDFAHSGPLRSLNAPMDKLSVVPYDRSYIAGSILEIENPAKRQGIAGAREMAPGARRARNRTHSRSQSNVLAPAAANSPRKPKTGTPMLSIHFRRDHDEVYWRLNAILALCCRSSRTIVSVKVSLAALTWYVRPPCARRRIEEFPSP